MNTEKFRNNIIYLVILSVLLASCSSVTPVTPTNTITPSNNPLPTRTVTPTVAPIEEVILDFALSPDGSKIAVYTNKGIYFYNTTTLEKSVFQEFDYTDYNKNFLGGAVAFSSDGTKLASSSKNAGGFVDVWDIKTGEIIRSIHDIPQGYYVTEIEFSPMGNMLFIRSTYPMSPICENAEDSLALYAINRPSEVRPDTKVFERNHCNYVPGKIRFTQDGKFYLFINNMGYDYWVFILNAETGEVLEDTKYDIAKDSYWYDVSSDGAIFAILAGDANQLTTKLVDAKSKTTVAEIPYRVKLLDGVERFFIHEKTPSYVLIHGTNVMYYVWHYWENGSIKCTLDDYLLFPDAKFSSNNNYFAVPTGDNQVQIWKVATCEKLNTLSVSE